MSAVGSPQQRALFRDPFATMWRDLGEGDAGIGNHPRASNWFERTSQDTAASKQSDVLEAVLPRPSSLQDC